MSSYRPICDTWILARSKVAYHGAFPEGFLSRARILLGATDETPILHVCAGQVRHCPGFGAQDRTVDANAQTNPDYLQDVTEPFPAPLLWRAILMDPPYTPEDGALYPTAIPDIDQCPSPAVLLTNAANAVRDGARVGILHYLWPRPPPGLRSIAVVTVLTGFNNRARLFSVYEKRAESTTKE